MKIFNCIMGVFSIFGSIYCIFFPGMTFLTSGWIVTMLLGVIGICSIFEYASNKNKGENKKLIANGVIGLILGIAAAVISVMAVFSPALRAMIDIIILVMFAFWLTYSGISSVAMSFSAKKQGGKSWIVSLILGVCVTIMGIYSMFNLLFPALTIGYIIGINLMIYGIKLLSSAFEKTL